MPLDVSNEGGPLSLMFYKRAFYRYQLWTGTYMLDFWEQALFNALLFGFLMLSFYLLRYDTPLSELFKSAS